MINPVTDPLDTSSLTLMSEPLEEAATNVSDDINQAIHHESSIAGSESDDDDGIEGSSNESYRRRHAQSVIAGNNPFANPSYRDLSGLSKGPAKLKPGEQYRHFGQGAPGIVGGAASSGSGEYHADTGFRGSEYYTGRESVGGGFDFGAQKAASNMYGDYMGNSNFGRQIGSGQSVLDNLYANMSRI